jgi:hypothetical protein
MNRWVRFGTDLELLDSPGILPMRISDQTAAIKLAICDDIGERSYDFADVAAILVQMLIMHPAVGQLSNKLVANMLYVLLLVIHPQDSFVFVFLTFACYDFHYALPFILCMSSMMTKQALKHLGGDTRSMLIATAAKCMF